MKTSKILLPLATLVAAGAIAIGSGASFTSSSENTISSVTTGTLTQSNSKDKQAIFSVANMKPGDGQVGTVTITNTGTLAGNFTLTQAGAVNPFGTYLTLSIKRVGDTEALWTGPFDTLPKAGIDLGRFDVKKGATPKLGEDANGYIFTVSLDKETPNSVTDPVTKIETVLQGATASSTFKWDAIQDAARTQIQPATKTTPNTAQPVPTPNN